MGCFNATCSLSDLTIHSGDKCLLFPLLPTRFNSDKHGVIKIGPSSMFVSNEGAYMFYVPMCFPIRGEYNDYGSIENIVKDENTKAIEERFKMSIEDFVSIITDGRKSMSDDFSDTFQQFAINKKLFDYNTHLNEKFLKSIGFEVVNSKDKTFRHPEAEGFLVKLIPIKKERKDNHYKKPFAYQIINETTGKVKKPTDLHHVEKLFVRDFYEMSNYMPNVKPEDQETAALLMATSGMFVLEEIYNLYTKENIPHTVGSDSYLEPAVLEKMGFKFRCVDKKINRYNKVYEFPGVTDYVINSDGTWSHIVKTSKEKPNTGKQEGYTYRPFDLIKEWKNLTGIDLPVDKKFLKQSKYDLIFDELQKQLNSKNGEQDEMAKMMEENRQRHLKALSNEKEFEKSFNEMLESYKKQEKSMKKSYKELAEGKDSTKEAEEEEIDDILDLSDRDVDEYWDKEFKDLAKKTKQIYEENAFLIDDNSPLEERKALWRSRLEGFVKEDNLEKRLSRLNNPIGHEQLRMKMPVPNYTFKNFEFTSEIYKSRFKSGVMKQYYLDFCHFYYGMSNNHKFFSPAAYGTQEDNSLDKKLLAEKIIEIAKERKRQYQEEY